MPSNERVPQSRNLGTLTPKRAITGRHNHPAAAGFRTRVNPVVDRPWRAAARDAEVRGSCSLPGARSCKYGSLVRTEFHDTNTVVPCDQVHP